MTLRVDSMITIYEYHKYLTRLLLDDSTIDFQTRDGIDPKR